MNSPMQPPSDALTARTIHAIIQVHQALGPGFLESIYHRALRIELRHQGLRADVEREVTIRYRGDGTGPDARGGTSALRRQPGTCCAADRDNGGGESGSFSVIASTRPSV
jgi:hypothetical protein